ncbi:MAG TPA: cupin domain-containing protein [Mycobacteriales bacterium]
MLVVRTGSADPVELHGARFTSCSAPSKGGTELAMWTVDVPPGTPATPHRVDREEILYVLSGRLTVAVDGRSVELAAGDTVAAPAGSLLSVGAVGAPARLLACTRAGLTATLADGTVIAPPWAQ